MIPDGLNRVVCSKCGLQFEIEKDGYDLSPEYCPDCEGIIIRLEIPIDGSRIIAIVEKL